MLSPELMMIGKLAVTWIDNKALLFCSCYVVSLNKVIRLIMLDKTESSIYIHLMENFRDILKEPVRLGADWRTEAL